MRTSFPKRSKEILRDIYLEVKHARKYKVKDQFAFIKNYIQVGLLHAGWTWKNITDILINIEIKMRDVGKDVEFIKLYRQFCKQDTLTYINWVVTDVIIFLSRLAVDHTDILEAIVDGYWK